MPLDSWACDSCGDEIAVSDADNALVINRVEMGSLECYGFRVVHKNIDGRTCDPGAQAGFVNSLELSAYLGHKGMARLLALLSPGPLLGTGMRVRMDAIDNYVDLFRRLQTPWYEEARKRFDEESVQSALDDANEVLPYIPDTLERIARHEI